jgi:hypothetical protein
MSSDQDRQTLYLRKQEKREIKGKFLGVNTPQGRIHWSLPLKGEFGLLVGKAIILNKQLFPFLHVSGTKSYLYNVDEALEHIEPLLAKRKRWWKPQSTKQVLESFYNQPFPMLLRPLAEEHPIILLDYYFQYDNVQQAWSTIVLNPRLQDIEFFRKMDTYTVYQEITMFMYNRAFPNRPIPHVSDEDLITAKGFNQYSFRKDPCKKK